MSKKQSKPAVSPDKDETQENPRVSQRALREQWEKESNRNLNESALRDRPEWMKAIGDEDEHPKRIEADFEAYGWEMQGEDDYVSDPTSESDMPGWVADDYDDEHQDKLKKRQDDVMIDED